MRRPRPRASCFGRAAVLGAIDQNPEGATREHAEQQIRSLGYPSGSSARSPYGRRAWAKHRAPTCRSRSGASLPSGDGLKLAGTLLLVALNGVLWRRRSRSQAQGHEGRVLWSGRAKRRQPRQVGSRDRDTAHLAVCRAGITVASPGPNALGERRSRPSPAHEAPEAVLRMRRGVKTNGLL